MVNRLCRAALAATLLVAPTLGVAAETLVIDAARVLTAAGAPIEKGRIVVKDGRITDAGADVKRPAFSRLIDARHLVVTPGFVVPATRLPLPPPPPPAPGEGLRVEIKTDVKAADEIRWRDASLAALLRAGVTTAGVLPIAREPGIPGFASAVSTVGGAKADALIAEDAALVVIAATPEPWRRPVIAAFEKADEARFDREDGERRGRDVKGDPAPLEKVMTRKKPVILWAPTPTLLAAAADAMPLSFLDASVLDGTDLWWEARRVKALGLRVITYPNLTRQRGTRFPINRAAEWAEASVKVAFALPDDSIDGADRLRDAVIELVSSGLSEELALQGLTSEAAAALGQAENVGSVQKGRRADLLFWSGSPFDPTSRLERVMVGGRFVERPEPAEMAP